MANAQTMGDLVKSARSAQGLTLRELGERLGGFSPAYLHDIEHGRRDLPVKHWKALAEALPTLDLAAFAMAAIKAGPVTIDARTVTQRQQATIAAALLLTADM